MDSPDFIVIVGRDKATVNPQTPSATVWMNKNMVANHGFCTVDSEAAEEIVKYIQDSHWTVEVK